MSSTNAYHSPLAVCALVPRRGDADPDLVDDRHPLNSRATVPVPSSELPSTPTTSYPQGPSSASMLARVRSMDSVSFRAGMTNCTLGDEPFVRMAGSRSRRATIGPVLADPAPASVASGRRRRQATVSVVGPVSNTPTPAHGRVEDGANPV